METTICQCPETQRPKLTSKARKPQNYIAAGKQLVDTFGDSSGCWRRGVGDICSWGFRVFGLGCEASPRVSKAHENQLALHMVSVW